MSIRRGILHILLIFAAVLQLMPLYWLLLFSLKNNQEAFGKHPLAFPEKLRFENYERVWTVGNIDNYFINSVWYTATSTIATVFLASMATYAITRMRWKGSKLALGVFMVGIMIPVHATLIPLFQFYLRLGLINHPLSLILSYIAFNLPITIMVMLGFYYSLPRELEEAAIIDGCSVNRMFFRIVLPMTGSVVTTSAIINMIYNWNEFIFVNTFISSDTRKTLTVGIQNFVGQYAIDWGAIGATLMISILPILAAYLVLSDRIVEAITAGSLKG